MAFIKFKSSLIMCLGCAWSALGIGVGLVCFGFWLRVLLLVARWLSFLGPVSRGPFVLGSGVFGMMGLESGCCVAAVLSGMLGGARGVVVGSAYVVAVVGLLGCSSGWDSGCALVWSLLLWLVRRGAGGSLGRWVVVGGFLSIILYLVKGMVLL